ncbi:hypothetical protein WJX73_006825 [Symbiochloris irregularis]|uniref:Uncharacterized protein n=1 Tax=Symbiochloris irregularis TaxID=706552 RepID=A0AAW1P6J0_9CHLO
MKKVEVPDFIRRAIRQGLGVGLAVCFGYIFFEQLTGVSSRAAQQWLQGCKWAAITIIVVSAPVLGKVTQVSFERTLGTIAGGLLGYVTVTLGHKMLEASDIVFTGTISSLVGGGAVIAGWALGLDYSAKLFVMTFLLVVMGTEQASDAFLVALTRISGILLGVLLSLALSVCVFPKSASHQATDNLGAALQGLIQLSQLAWDPMNDNQGVSSKNPSRPLGQTMAQGFNTLFDGVQSRLLDAEVGEGAATRPSSREEMEVKCEKVMMDIYASLARSDEFIKLSQSERFFMVINGRWCFLPLVPFLPGKKRWCLPQREMSELATSIRKVTRVLWAFRAALAEGFESVIQAMESRYPGHMLLDLRMHSQGALKDAADAFDRGQLIVQSNLEAFLHAVSELIAVSEHQRRVILGALAASIGQHVPSEVDSASDTLSQGSGGKDGHPPFRIPGRAVLQEGGGVQTVPQLDMSKVDFFSPDAAGHSAKVRWHAFQFMMNQFGEELSPDGQYIPILPALR